MMAAILNSAILNLAILDSVILVFSFKLTHTCQDWFPPFAQKNFTHSFWLNLMMAAILKPVMLDSDTAILESDTLLSSFKFTQKHSHSTLTLTQTNSIWHKLIHSHLTWWWQPSWILPSWIWPSRIWPSWYFLSNSLTLAKIGSHHFHKSNFTHSFWLNLMMAAILNSATLDSDTLLSSLRFTQKHSHSTLTLTHTNSIWLKLIYSHLTWWWQPSWIWPCWIQPSYYFLWNSLTLAKIGSHHLQKTNLTHSFWLNLMMAAILNSVMLDSDTLLSSLRYTQKHSHSTLTLTHTNSIWLKCIYSHLTWWW